MTAETPQKQRYVGRWIAVSIVGVIVLALLAAIGWYFLRINPSVQQVETIESAFPDESLRPEAETTDAGAPVNVLLLGTDTRGQSDSLLTDLGDRADVILVAHIPPDRETVQIMSIMRDSWVEIPGHGNAKVNAALALGGVPLMVQTVETIIDQRIDHVGIIDFEGFEGLTEALGGVRLQNDIAFSVDEFDYPSGEITISGEEALAYVRARYPFSDGDYQRTHNQRAFLRGLMTQTMTRENLTNPNRMADIFATVSPHVATTDTFQLGSSLPLAASLAGIDNSSINTFTMPTLGTGMEGSQSVVYVNWDGVEEIRAAFDEESMTTFEPAPER
ncbi:LCP family protein [Agrococcus carbonis]|uniref:Cell envelope-related function transcriptional attenuator common domain-containing protein n=1 Tax=Agrococcus carbonis TaxID=684552 RepID=A0A1H1QD73_9MICO|nr:LCP family protein [Agrococcus carbonis]SDS21442.1 cell envelope-related function transcriptional attenuator common domain-containing protein [Agrococcus carbonis]